MKGWRPMDESTAARINGEVPGVFATTGYCEGLDEARMMQCKTPACFRMWAFPKEYEGKAAVRTGRVVPGLRRQLLPVTLTLGFIFDSKRGLGGEDVGYGDMGSLTVVPRTIQVVMDWSGNDFEALFHQPFEFLGATESREGTRSFWEVELANLIDEPFVR